MKIKIYLFRLSVAFTAFIVGISFFSAGQYLKSAFQIKNQEAIVIHPVTKQEIVVALPVVEQSINEQASSTSDSQENTEYEFDVSGSYYIYSDLSESSNLPKAFEDFNEISITTTDYENASSENDYQGIPVPPKGYIFTKKEYKFTRINIANKQIAFQTETKKGISYKFAGNFIDNRNYSENEDYADLEGRLIKMRNGKKIAETKVRLITGGC